MTKAVILQPTYLPWIGYFDLIKKSDVFVFLDSVQFEKRSWQQRNRIKTPHGWIWLTVPVKEEFKRICDTEINNSVDWATKHWKTIYHSYARAPHFGEYKDFFEQTYHMRWKYLVDLNVHIIKYVASSLGLEPNFQFSSKMDVHGKKQQLLIEICKKVGANVYLANVGSRKYIGEGEEFKEAGIKLEYHEFKHPIYPQLFGDFVPYMSAIDLLFNVGHDSAKLVWG